MQRFTEDLQLAVIAGAEHVVGAVIDCGTVVLDVAITALGLTGAGYRLLVAPKRPGVFDSSIVELGRELEVQPVPPG